MNNAIRICTSKEMRELDQIASVEFGISAKILMENAARSAAEILLLEYPQSGIEAEIIIVAGKGNNAGDAFALARRLICLERKVRVFHLASEDSYEEAALENFKILKTLRAKMSLLDSVMELEAFFDKAQGPVVVVDGILGTGLKDNLEGIFYEVVDFLNRLSFPIVSLDIPTGVCGDTGQVRGNAIYAALTISFGFPKLGHFLPPGASRRGKLVNVDISLPPKFRKDGQQFLITKESLTHLLSFRDRYAHKNTFGHSLVIGGSVGRLGAVCMAANASLKVGTGLVTVATWENAFQTLCQKLSDEIMAFPIHLSGDRADLYRDNLNQYSSLVVGPGLGLYPEGKELLQELLGNFRGPIVLDADALNLISEHRLHNLIQKRQLPTVLTPHPGEMARLIGWSKDKVVEKPVDALTAAVDLTHAVVILKGPATLIGSPKQPLYLSHYPNDGMAKAGSGDVLAGVIGSLLGQRMEPFQASLLGVMLHSLSGEIASKKLGHRSMTAKSIIENLGQAFKLVETSGSFKNRPDHQIIH